MNKVFRAQGAMAGHGPQIRVKYTDLFFDHEEVRGWTT